MFKDFGSYLIVYLLPYVGLCCGGWFDTTMNTISNGWCSVFACCDETWSNAKLRELDVNLKYLVYGQHIAQKIVVAALKSHISGNNKKPLVMSFHGWPGSGKNYVTQFIMQSLFKEGEFDRNVHLFSGKAHFPLDGNVEQYQVELLHWIRGNVSVCKNSLFVFDEVDKMPPGIFDSIKPFLDHHTHINRINFRDTIFIFLSNTGGHKIVNRVVELYQQGKKRQDLELKDFEDLITVGAFNEMGGLKNSDAISGNVIDHYVPFLPLEEEHVEKCISDAFRFKGSHNPSREDVKKVLEYITFGPEEMKLFSNSGCKRIAQKVAAILEITRYGSHAEL